MEQLPDDVTVVKSSKRTSGSDQQVHLQTDVGLQRTLRLNAIQKKSCTRWRERCARCQVPMLVVARSANPIQLLLHCRGKSATLTNQRLRSVCVSKKNKFVTSSLLLRLRLRLEALWEELCIPWVDRDFFLVRFCLDPNQIDVRRIVDQILVLLAHRNRVLQVLALINQREKLLHWLQNHPPESFWWRQVLSELVRKSVQVVEAIQDWRSGLWRPHPFLWRGRVNYLLKMQRDLDGYLPKEPVRTADDTKHPTDSMVGLEQAAALLQTEQEAKTSAVASRQRSCCQREQRAILYLHGEQATQMQLQQELKLLTERNQFIPLLRWENKSTLASGHVGCVVVSPRISTEIAKANCVTANLCDRSVATVTVPSDNNSPSPCTLQQKADKGNLYGSEQSARAASAIQSSWRTFRSKQSVHRGVIVLQRWWRKHLRAQRYRLEQRNQRMEAFKRIWRKRRNAVASTKQSGTVFNDYTANPVLRWSLQDDQETLATLQSLEQHLTTVQETLVESAPNSLGAKCDCIEDLEEVLP